MGRQGRVLIVEDPGSAVSAQARLVERWMEKKIGTGEWWGHLRLCRQLSKEQEKGAEESG